MTTQVQDPTPNQTPDPASAAQPPQGNEGNVPGDKPAEKPAEGNDPANTPADAGEKAAAQAAADTAAAEKAAAEKAAADEKAATEKFQAKAKAEMDAAVTSWKDAVKADPKLGGEKLDATLIDVDKAIKAVGDQELVDFLEKSQLRHYPPLVRMLAQVGSRLKEGSILNGPAPGAKPKSRAERMYDNTPPAK